MAGSTRKYDYYGTAAPQRAPRRQQRASQRPGVQVIPGSNADHLTLPPALVTGFKFAIAIVVAMIIVCSVRVWLSAATVQSLQNVETLQSSIEKAYASGDELEIEHSVLASPSRIQSKAKALGMTSPDSRTFIKVKLAPKFAYNDNGTVSIHGTIRNIKDSKVAKSKK